MIAALEPGRHRVGARSSARRSTVAVSGTRVLGLLAGAVLLWLVARRLDLRVFGPEMAWTSALALVQVVADFGTSTFAVRELARDRGWPGFLPLLRLRAGVAVLLLAVAGGAAALPVVLGITGAQAACFVVFVAAHQVADFAVCPSLAARRQVRVAVLQAGERVLSLVVFVVACHGMRAADAYPVALGAAALGYLLLVRGVCGRADRRTRRRPRVLPLLRRSGAFFGISAGSQIQNLDVAVVALAAGSVASGLYALPSRLTNPLTLVVVSYCTVLLPRVAAKPDLPGFTAVMRVIVRLGVAGCALYGLAIVVVGPVVALVFGPDYRGSVGAFRVILVAMMALTVNLPLATVLVAFGRERATARAILASALFGLPATYLGARLDGATGGAVGWLAVQVFLVAALGLTARTVHRSLVSG